MIHWTSGLSAGPFVRVNCFGIPAELLAVDLFGNAGAPGALARAEGGTAFLDEVA